jgi:pilin isopeptide linkage protein/LPXTG-motif cell wall-anchored protein
MKNRCLSKILSVFIGIVAMAMLCMPVMASTAEEHAARQPDYSRKGSIAVDIKTTDGTALGGGTIRAIQVADALYDNGDNLLVYTEGFNGCSFDLQNIDLEETGAPELAEELAAWASERQIKGTEKEINDSGRVIFENLPLGLYLFVQDTPAVGYDCVHPFLVTIPYWDGEKLVYDMEAWPKPGTATGLAYYEPTVQKVVKGKTDQEAENLSFQFGLIPAKKDQPMPAPEGGVTDPETGTVFVKHGAGTFSFGKIWFGKEDVGKKYLYKIRERDGGISGFTYDSEVYLLTLEVTEDEEAGEVVCNASIKGKDGKEASRMVFTNVYKASPSTPGKKPSKGSSKLPQTGQLWWPVPLLALTGLLALAAGYIRRKES